MRSALHYRVQQFFRAITAGVQRPNVEEALKLLPQAAQDLFLQQSRQDRRHALAVFDTLQSAGYRDRHLLAAALLHDVGKATAHLPAWQRAVIVLMKRYLPGTLAALSRGPEQGWRRSFVVHARHAAISGQRAEKAGCSPLTVALIRRHHETVHGNGSTKEDTLLEALQAADSSN